MHGVRSAKNERFRQFAIMRGSGPFVPAARECGPCEEMGWVTWPGSPLGRWRCCGRRVQQHGSRLRACTGKACPDVEVAVLRAVKAGAGDGLLSEYARKRPLAKLAKLAVPPPTLGRRGAKARPPRKPAAGPRIYDRASEV